MEKTKLLLLPFFVGLILIILSWYLSYPITTIAENDFVFYHISIFYWFGLPILLVSMFLMALTTKSTILKWLLSIGFVVALYSLSYFYSLMPVADSQFFRGLTEYFIKTRSLDASQLNLMYYQWPGYFLLADVVTSISGLTLASYEFLIYTIIAFLLATTLFVYATKKHKMAGFLTVAVFFLSMVYFLDYQSAPFSLALGILFLLFMLETRKKTPALMAIMLVLYACLLFTHLFVPVFFVLYSLIRSLFDKNKQNKSFYRNFFLFTLVSYFIVQITIAQFNFDQILANITLSPTTYSSIVSQTTASAHPVFTDIIAQYFSRAVTITSVGLCFVGFIFLFIRKEMDAIDKAILLIGVLYSVSGVILNTIGYRGISIAFIPISLGAAFLFKSKFKRHIGGLLVVLSILVLFVPLHLSFNPEIYFQTKETYIADNFLIDNYHWEKPGFVIADFRTIQYVQSKLSNYVFIYDSWVLENNRPDVILYTPQFVGGQLGNYSSMETLSQGEGLDLLYNDGISYVIMNANP